MAGEAGRGASVCQSAYRKKHGEAGIQLTRWDWLRTHPKEAGPLFWYDDETAERLGPGFRRGDPALDIHVPATEPLTREVCDESLDRMRTAFAGVYRIANVHILAAG
jgi:hypothetical protein